MEMEGLEEIFNTVYVAKKLYDIDKYELVTENFYDELCLDAYYENMYRLIPNLFEYCYGRYSEYRGLQLVVLSDQVIVDFYTLAGEYGRKHDLSDEENPYIAESEEQARRELGFSYCLDWRLKGYAEPKRPFHSRLVLFIFEDDWVDVGYLAYGLIEIYEWFSDACVRLRDALKKNESNVTEHLKEEVIAA